MPLLTPQPVRDSLGLKRMKTFVEQKGRGKAVTSGVSVADRHDVDFGGSYNRGVFLIRFIKDFPDSH